MQGLFCYESRKEIWGATRAVSKKRRRGPAKPPPPPQGKALKEIHAILTDTLGEHAPLYATVKNWVAKFKRVDFSTCDTPRRGRPKTVTTPEIIDQIHKLILEDCRISAKSIAEQLGISRELIGSIIHEDLDMRKLSAKCVPTCLNADQKRQRCQLSEQLLEFFRHDPNDFLSRLLTMDEPWLYHYDPETKEQSKEWRHSGFHLPPPQKKYPSAKIRWESSRLDFFGSRRHTPHSLSSKGPKYQCGVFSYAICHKHPDSKHIYRGLYCKIIQCSTNQSCL